MKNLDRPKIGRNDVCPCGSEKKYKKCCLSDDKGVLQNIPARNQKKNILVKTLTNELFQPMRLYYVVHADDQLETCFKKLKCLIYHSESNDWVVEYANEAANIGLERLPKEVPKEMRPLIIATIYRENKTTMLVDVRSIERAKSLIQFIDKYVPRNVAEITYAAIYNQLVSIAHEEIKEGVSGDVDYDDIFNEDNIFIVDPEKTIREMREVAEAYPNEDERMDAMFKKAREDLMRPLPQVEKFPVYFYEEGIESFSIACQFRQAIAIKHYHSMQSDYLIPS